MKLSTVRTINEGRLFQTLGAQHENRRAAMFVNEDCIESRSDVDDLTTRDCLYDESRPVRYEGCCSLITEDGNLVVAFSVRFDGEGLGAQHSCSSNCQSQGAFACNCL